MAKLVLSRNTLLPVPSLTFLACPEMILSRSAANLNPTYFSKPPQMHLIFDFPELLVTPGHSTVL